MCVCVCVCVCARHEGEVTKHVGFLMQPLSIIPTGMLSICHQFRLEQHDIIGSFMNDRDTIAIMHNGVDKMFSSSHVMMYSGKTLVIMPFSAPMYDL